MDEITQKRIGKAQEGLVSGAASIASQFSATLPHMEALIDELRKHRPPWAVDVCLLPGIFVAAAAATLKRLQAPEGYVGELVRQLAAHSLEPDNGAHCTVFPMGDAEAPEWITAPRCEHDDPWDAIGGRGDQVDQASRILAWSMSEIVAILHDDVRLNIAEAGGDPAADPSPGAEVSERMIKIVMFYAETMGPVMAVMMG